jgi:hypothetical protein
MAGTIAPNIVTDGLVLYLDAANTKSYVSGSTTWNDMSGFSNNGTLTNGPTFNSGSGGSIVFDGTNDYASIPHNSALNLFPITLAAWVNITTGGDIINKYVAGSLNGYRFNVATSGVSVYYFQSGFVNYTADYDTKSGTAPANVWHYVAVTVNTGGATIYINGNQVGTRAWIGTPGAPTTTQAISLARYPAINTSYFGGRIAQSQIYNRALLAQEILQNYNATKTRFGL